jgi:hypothetical protein
VTATFQAGQTTLSTTVVHHVFQAAPQAFTIDAPTQALLAGANATPASAIAVGQLCTIFTVIPTVIANGGTVGQAGLDDPLTIMGTIVIRGGV